MNVYSCKNEKKSTFSNHRVQVKLAKYCNGSHIKKKKIQYGQMLELLYGRGDIKKEKRVSMRWNESLWV